MPDLEPQFPLPAPGDQVLILATGAGSMLWGRVVRVETGPLDLFPVIVEFPGGGRGAYQQHEIRGHRPRRRWWRLGRWGDA